MHDKKGNFQRHTYLPKEIYDVKNVTHEDLKIARELKKTPTAAKPVIGFKLVLTVMKDGIYFILNVENEKGKNGLSPVGKVILHSLPPIKNLIYNRRRKLVVT